MNSLQRPGNECTALKLEECRVQSFREFRVQSSEFRVQIEFRVPPVGLYRGGTV